MTDPTSSSKLAIAVYTPQQIEDVARMLKDTSAIGNDRDRLAEFVFQHSNGAWWTVDPETHKWHRHVQGTWSISPSPGGTLLGPAWVGQLVAFDRDENFFEDEFPEMSLESRSSNTPQELAMAIAQIQDAFAAGAYDSVSAEALLRKFYLIDSHWQLWTVGVRSSEWYVLKQQGWMAQPQGPSELAPADASDFGKRALESQIPILSDHVPALPELIIPSWLPPKGLCPTVFKETNAERHLCSHCNATLALQARFCSLCGTPVNPHMQPPTPPTIEPPQRPRIDEPMAQPNKRSGEKGTAKPSKKVNYLFGAALALVFVILSFFLIVWLDDQVFVSTKTMYWRGENYRTGEQVPKDPEEALYWLKRAAKKGHAGAMFSLGNMYYSGEGVVADLAMARDYYKQSANAGHREAMLRLATMSERGEGGPVDIHRAYELRERANNQR